VRAKEKAPKTLRVSGAFVGRTYFSNPYVPGEPFHVIWRVCFIPLNAAVITWLITNDDHPPR
jgi:hypothetical protein